MAAMSLEDLSLPLSLSLSLSLHRHVDAPFLGFSIDFKGPVIVPVMRSDEIVEPNPAPIGRWSIP